jgi:hypothetical protein
MMLACAETKEGVGERRIRLGAQGWGWLNALSVRVDWDMLILVGCLVVA